MGQGGAKIVRVDITDTYDPRGTGRAAQKGTIFRYIPAVGTPELLIKLDDGFTVNWQALGTSDAGTVTTVQAASPVNVDVANPPANIDGGAGGTVGDLWLLPNQTAPAENGVYIFNGAAIPLTRAVGWDQQEEFIPGRQVFVDLGATLNNTLWVNTQLVPVLGVDPVDFEEVDSGLPTGTADTGAYFDAAGVLSSTANFAFSVALFAMSFISKLTGGTGGATASGALAHGATSNTADLTASGAGAHAHGTLNGAGSTVVASGAASHAHGVTTAGGDIVASGDSSLAHGFATGAGANITSLGQSSQAHGVATAGCTITTTAIGAVAHGHADNVGSMTASGVGSHASGYSSGATLVASGVGAVAHGSSDVGGDLSAVGVGSHASGNAFGGTITATQPGGIATGTVAGAGIIRADGPGGYAAGQADTTGLIESFAVGAIVSGSAEAAAIIRSGGTGALAMGYSAGGQILTSAIGAQAMGQADTGTIEASAIGSHAHGRTQTASFITSSGVGSKASGNAAGAATISSPGIGSQAFGDADTDSLIRSFQNGSLAHGCSYTSAQIDATGDGSTASGLTEGVGCAIVASAVGAQAHGQALAASQIQSSAVGAIASGDASGGNNITASGPGSLCMGISAAGALLAGGTASVVIGEDCVTVANYSQVFGVGQDTSSYACMVIGRFGVSNGTGGAWVATEPVFVVGNGANAGARANAYQIDKDGKVTETGANVVPVRVITGNDALSARTDRKFILNDVAAGANVITLPAGEAGLTYDFGFATGSTGTWTLTPAGADTVDAALATAIGTTSVNSFSMTFSGGAWYLV